jgi:hypothetical protein
MLVVMDILYVEHIYFFHYELDQQSRKVVG